MKKCELCGEWSRSWPFCEPCEANRVAHLASFPGEGFAERVLRSERWAERLGAQPVMGLLAESIHDKLQKLLYGDSSAPEPVGVLRGSSPVATFVDEKHSWSKEQADRFYDGFGKPTSSP